MIFSLYFPILLSLSLSFFLHAFKKHIHSFLGLAATSNTTNNATDNNYNKLHLKCHRHISSTATTIPPRLIDDIGVETNGLMACTESNGFESIDERLVDDQIDEKDDDNNNDNSDDCWRRMRVAEGRGNWRKVERFPPPLSSLDGNGQPSFILLPMRKNKRLQLIKVRIKRPEILHARRQDGRLRLYLIPDPCILDDLEQDECEWEEEEEELEAEQTKEETTEELEEQEQEEEEDEVVEEIEYEEEDRVIEWKFPFEGNEGFRRCREVVNHIQCHHVHGKHHHHHHHIHMYEVSIA